MPYCSACGYQNPDDVGICLNCAAAFGRSCPACEQPVPAGNRFCGQCGARMPEEGRAPPAASLQQDDVLQSLRAMMPTTLAEKINTAGAEVLGERREVTVVFVDVSNFTAAAHGLDSEDAFILIDEAMRLLVQVVYKYEGTVDKFTGDGLMALFGAPVAHENDPERAVRAALEMQTVLQPLRERVRQKHGFDFQARIGINTGLVVAGEVGSDLHMEYTVIGDTVNLASRLEAAAQPGAVLVSFATYQRTRPLFRFKTLPPLTVKGLPEPIQAFQALGLQEGSPGGRGLPGLQVPMIGRNDALVRLENALDEVYQHHHSLIVFVTGEAGLGKSRLVAEFRKSLSQPDISVYQGSCLAYARSRPLWLVAELLRDILHLSETEPAHIQRKTLQTYLGRLGLSNDEVLPYLTHLLGWPQTDPEIETRLRLLDASMLKRQTHTALRQVFLAEARLAPTVLIFEDLHWVDPASREFLEYLIQTTSDAPLMLVLVSRDAERETVIQPLIAIAEKNPERLVDIQLQALSEAEGRLLVDQLIKQTTQEARALKRRIAERAAGIPFYAEEIVRMLIDEGGLLGEDGIWQVTPRADELLGEVPGTLKGLILARFDRLPQNLRRTLQKAAVLGNSFPVSLLEMLNGASRETIAAQLSELEARQFLIAERFGSEPGYAFHHTLIQEAVYSTLLKRDRRTLHEKVGQAIERGAYWLPEEQTEVLAYHYAESATPLKAVPYLIAAAQNADRRCANETAIQHYRRAITLMEGQPTPGSEQAGYSDEFFRVRIGLARALKFVGEFAEASQLLLEVLQHLQAPTTDPGSFLSNIIDASRELADVRQREGAQDEAIAHLNTALDALGPAGAQEHPSLWRSLMDRMAWVRFRQGKLEEAFALASSATLGLDPKHTDDPTTLASLYNTLGGVLWLQGNLSAAIAYVERSLNLYKGLGYLWGMANAHTNLGVLHYARGNWSKAAENLEQAEALQQQIGDIQNRAVTLNNLGTLRQSMGEHEAARRDLEASLSIRQRLGDTWGIAQSQVSLARLAVVQSRFEDAVVHVEAALALSEALGGYETEARWILALAQADRDLQAGLESARQALQMAKAAGFAEAEADCRRVLGALQARAGEYREAEILLRESIDLCLQRNDPYRQGLALLELGRMCQRLVRAGHPDRAEWRAKALGALEEAVTKFKSLGAAHDLEMAQAALSQVQADMTAEASPRLPKGEWHAATIVWLSLSPPPGTDDEVFFEALSFVMPPLMSIAREQQGQVIRRQEGLAVVFGAPTAHEDDSERAVYTAWHMLKGLTGLSSQMEVPLIAKLAITQGDVIAGYIGHPSQPEFVVTGEPVLQAQRVAEAAPPGKVWVTQAVRAATDHLFLYEPVSSSDTDHLVDRAVAVLVGVREQPRPAQGLPGIQARLVGRDVPLKTMADLSQNLNRGVGGLIWIEGEAGIGKSRLMQEFASHMAASGTLVWVGRCSPHSSGHAFSLFSNLLTQVFDLKATDTPDQICARINRIIQTWPADAQATRAYLEILLGVKPAGLDGERLADLEPDQLQQQTFVALRSLLRSLAKEQPLVILLDDLQWIDPMSADLLLFLSNMVTSTPILFVCAQRGEGAETLDDRLIKAQSLHSDHTVRLFLDPLSMTESDTLLSELLPGADLPAPLRTAILERSDGNPYYIEELVRMLIQQGHLRHNPSTSLQAEGHFDECGAGSQAEGAGHHQGRWVFDSSVDLEDLPLPASLEALMRSRIDALPQASRQLLQYAAVIGRPFEVGLLESVSGQLNIEAALTWLESRGILRRLTETDQWQFSHFLMENVVYNTLLKTQRKALHLRVAQALEAQWAGSEDKHSEELAYHFIQAEEDARALNYLLLAGERAAAQYANEEALAYFQQVAQMLTTQPEATDSLRWRATAGLGDVYRFMGKYAESRAVLEAGLSLLESEQLDDDRRAGIYRRLGETAQKQGELETAREHFTMALATLGEPADRYARREAARILTSLAWNHFLQGDFGQARRVCEVGLDYARSADALNELATAENILGGIYYRQGELALALDHTKEAMALRKQMGYTWGVAATLSNLGVLAVSAGDWGEARSFFQQSLALRQEIGDVEGVAIAHNNLGSLLRDQGELDQAELHLRESLAVAKPMKMAYHVANATLGLAQVLLLQGQMEAAQEAIAASLAQAEAIGAQDLLAEIYRVEAEILLAQSAWDEANEAVHRAALLAAETGDRSLEATAWRVASESELQRGNLHAARESLTKARLALADVTDELEAARVAAQAGRLSLYKGDFAQAEKNLRLAEETFARLGASLDLKRVESARLSPPAQPSNSL